MQKLHREFQRAHRVALSKVRMTYLKSSTTVSISKSFAQCALMHRMTFMVGDTVVDQNTK